jgi:DNA polymerase
LDTLISAIDDVIKYVKNELQAGRRYVSIDKDIANDFLAATLTVPQNSTTPSTQNTKQNVAQQAVAPSQQSSSTKTAIPHATPIATLQTPYKKYRGTAINPLYAFIGYEPSYDADIEGKAFSGEQGVLLDKMIAAMGLNEQEYIILNIFEEPSKNFTGPAIENQVNILSNFIKQVSPSVIILMGDEACRLLLKTNSPVANIHGMRNQLFDKPCIPTYHPKYLLRYITAKKSAWADLKNALAILNRKPPTQTKK